MKFPRNCIFTAALAASILLMVSGCKSNQQATSGSQPASDATQQSAAQPSGAPQPSGAVQPSGAPRRSGMAQPSGSAGAPSRTAYGSNAPSTPPPPAAVDLPAGTSLRVRLDQDLGSKISQTGDTFTATVADDVIVNGQTVIPKGARADGTVVDAAPLGRFKGGAVLQIRLDRVHTNWGSYPVATTSIAKVEQGKGKRTALFAGGGGALGALIGGLAGGGKGALIGAAAGAGAGTAGGAFTGNKQIVLPAETLLTFRLESSVHIVEGQ